LHVSRPFAGVFGRAALRPLPPPLPPRPGELPAHEDNHFAFPQPELGLNGFKRRTILPGHFNDPFYLRRRKINSHVGYNNAAGHKVLRA
jgi:hypothetical protein